jgi:subtilase family serine protease
VQAGVLEHDVGGAVADVNGAVAESNETNNTLGKGIRIKK